MARSRRGPQRSEDTRRTAGWSPALDQLELDSAVRFERAEDCGPGEFARACGARLCEGPDVLAVDEFDADGAESVEVSFQAGWRAWAALVRGKMIMGTVATHSHRTVRAWLSAMPRASLATLLAVMGAPTNTSLLG